METSYPKMVVKNGNGPKGPNSTHIWRLVKYVFIDPPNSSPLSPSRKWSKNQHPVNTDTYGRMWSESWRAFAVFVYPCPDPCGNAPLLTCAKPGRLGQQINLGRWSRGMAESKLPFRGEKWSRKCPQPQTHLSIQGIGREVKHRWASTTSARAGFGFVLAALYSPNFNIYTGWKYMVLVRF